MKDIEAALKEGGAERRALGERILKSLGACGAAHGAWPGVCGRTGTAICRSDGVTLFIVYRCPEHQG